MKIFDIALKNAIAKTSTSFPLASVTSLASKLQTRCDYLLKVCLAPPDVQIALRNAIASDNRKFPQYVVSTLAVLLSSQFTGISHTTSLDVPTTLPAGSLGQPVGTVIVEDTTASGGFPSAGTFLLNTSNGQQTVSYTGKTSTSFTGCTGGSGSAGQGNVITEGGVPSVAEAEARKDLFIAAFTRRFRNAIGALNYINSLHVWSWEP